MKNVANDNWQEKLEEQDKRDHKLALFIWKRNLEVLAQYRDDDTVILGEMNDHGRFECRTKVGPARQRALSALQRIENDTEFKLDYGREIQANEWYVLGGIDPFRRPRFLRIR